MPCPRTTILSRSVSSETRQGQADFSRRREPIAFRRWSARAQLRKHPFLAPDIVRAIVEGRQPVGLTSSYLLHHPLPDDWEKQRVLVKTL